MCCFCWLSQVTIRISVWRPCCFLHLFCVLSFHSLIKSCGGKDCAGQETDRYVIAGSPMDEGCVGKGQQLISCVHVQVIHSLVTPRLLLLSSSQIPEPLTKHVTNQYVATETKIDHILKR